MSSPLSSVNGLASGVQWQDLVAQIIAAESAQRVAPINRRSDLATNQATAWKRFEELAATLRDTTTTLRDPSVFAATTASVPSSAAGVLTASSGAAAVPGRYDVQVLQLASTEKVGGGIVTDASTALGVTGAIVINGRAVTVAATDTLGTLRDKVNAANTGAGASGVSAVIQGSGTGARLVLTAADTGVSGIELSDATVGTLAALGLSDGTTSANIRPTGEMQSYRASSSTTAIATAMGVTAPAAATLNVGGAVVAVDLATDTLATLAARINGALGRSDAARIENETANGRTQSRLVTTVPVGSDGSVDAAASARTMALLGFTTTGRGGVAQVVASAGTYTDGVGTASPSTLLSNLGGAGGSLGLANGDVVTVRGSRGDGSAVIRTLTVGAGTTVQDLLDTMNNGGSGFGAGTRPATTAINGSGRLTLTDGTAGDSQLGVSITVAKAGGGTTTLGAFGTAQGTVGRAVSITAGRDANVLVDGRVSSQRTNAVTSAIAGVTLNLEGVSGASPLTLTVGRDTTGIAAKVTAMTSAYNALRTWVTTNTARGGVLANDQIARGMIASLTNAITGGVAGLASGATTNAVLFGLQHDKTGVLSLDATAFANALASQPSAVQQLFSMTGDATDGEVSFVTGTAASKPSVTPYAVNITQAATQAQATGAVWSAYATTGAPDTMTITDGFTGAVASVSLANGDGIDAVINRMNGAFAAQGLTVTAGKTVDGRLQLTSRDYGSAGALTVAYTPGAGGDGTALLGIAAGSRSGLNVAGTIHGVVALGSGQSLTGAAGDASEGLVIRYTGTTARAAGTVRFSQGLNGVLARLAATMAAGSTSVTDQRITALERSVTDFAKQITTQQARLDAHRASLTRQFVAMESAIARTNAIASSLNSQINSLNSQPR